MFTRRRAALRSGKGSHEREWSVSGHVSVSLEPRSQGRACAWGQSQQAVTTAGIPSRSLHLHTPQIRSKTAMLPGLPGSHSEADTGLTLTAGEERASFTTEDPKHPKSARADCGRSPRGRSLTYTAVLWPVCLGNPLRDSECGLCLILCKDWYTLTRY